MPKKFFSIYPRTKEAMTHGLQTSRGLFDFGGKTIINTSNEKLAREMEEKYGQRQGGQVMVVHDEKLSKAKDSGSWDIIKTKRGDVVKNLHNYTFTANKPKPPTLIDNLKKIFNGKGWYWFFWCWDTMNPQYKREIGVRFFGMEFKKVLD